MSAMSMKDNRYTERFLEVTIESWPEQDLNSIIKVIIYFDL